MRSTRAGPLRTEPAEAAGNQANRSIPVETLPRSAGRPLWAEAARIFAVELVDGELQLCVGLLQRHAGLEARRHGEVMGHVMRGEIKTGSGSQRIAYELQSQILFR